MTTRTVELAEDLFFVALHGMKLTSWFVLPTPVGRGSRQTLSGSWGTRLVDARRGTL